MPLPSHPTVFVPRPFAESGNFQIVPDTTATLGRASFAAGFPAETQRPLSQGGVAPNRLDFNGLFHMLSALGFWQQSGGQWMWSETLNYAVPCLVYHGGKLWWCLKDNGPETANGAREPGKSETFWEEFLLSLLDQAGKEIDDQPPLVVGGGFNARQVLTDSGTWIAPVGGTYRVTCIGGGGGGGRGGNRSSNGGGGGGQGGTTSFGVLLNAVGGSGGAGGGTGYSGGGGGPGSVVWDYLKLTQGEVVTVSVGAGGEGAVGISSNALGENGVGIQAGMGGRFAGGGGAGGSNGNHGNGEGMASGGAGGLNGSGYGGGGGGGANGTNYPGNKGGGGAAGEGGARGQAPASNNSKVGGAGGSGGSGAVILEYYQPEVE